MAGGLSTIEEKSLGCVYKAGTKTLMDVIDYAKPVVSKGLTFMNTPGNDIEQLSAMVAGGANICVLLQVVALQRVLLSCLLSK